MIAAPIGSRAVAQARGDDAQVARGERQRALEDDFPHAREQLLVGLGDVAADDDRAGVEEVHAAREDLAEVAARVADGLDGLRLAGADERDHVPRGLGGEAGGGEVRRQRAAAGDRFQAADVAAAADDVVVAGEADVADVARGALGATVDATAGDDAAADAGADLHVQQVLDLAPVRPVLAERHDVHVVVDEDGRVVVAGEPARDREAVPAGHDRRRDGLAAREGDRAGDTDTDAAHVRGAAVDLGEQPAERLVDLLEHDLRAFGDIQVERRLRQGRTGEIGHHETRVGRAQIADQHDARALVEGQHRGRPPAGGSAAAGFVHELVREQGIQTLSDR